MKRTSLLSSLALSVLLMCGCQNPTSPTTSAGNATDTAAIIKDGVVKTILERRSIRKYTNQPIENEKLAQANQLLGPAKEVLDNETGAEDDEKE